ncbi:hypothetical protein FCE95_11240 [Luteimonas gilva]|uniref:Uncharacterized protein n=1 Tax=Luteimonas gilva TaxID=2572684 RepID=A0A4U5JMA3_9GAMM|nr:hypothetical protein [Luteimonas gilva]TKR30674.1 hypothetical protein FCE95_11240 [Luteimonas gilva]
MQDRPFTDIGSALASIDGFSGLPEDFVLAISDDMQDPMGAGMAIVADRILARGWLPAGFEQREGFRLYRYGSQDI